MIYRFFEIFKLDENGNEIDHKDQREHEELTFLNRDDADAKYLELEEQGFAVAMYQLG